MAGRKGARNGRNNKAKNRNNGPLVGVKDYRYEAVKWKNNPPAKAAAIDMGG